MCSAATVKEVTATEGIAVGGSERAAGTTEPVTQPKKKRRRRGKVETSTAEVQVGELNKQAEEGTAERQGGGQAVDTVLPGGETVGHLSLNLMLQLLHSLQVSRLWSCAST